MIFKVLVLEPQPLGEPAQTYCSKISNNFVASNMSVDFTCSLRLLISCDKCSVASCQLPGEVRLFEGMCSSLNVERPQLFVGLFKVMFYFSQREIHHFGIFEESIL